MLTMRTHHAIYDCIVKRWIFFGAFDRPARSADGPHFKSFLDGTAPAPGHSSPVAISYRTMLISLFDFGCHVSVSVPVIVFLA